MNTRATHCLRLLIVASILVPSAAAPQPRRITASDPEGPSHHQTVTVTLTEYWVETITREEALRRLALRPLDPVRRAKIERQIPLVTRHYITSHGNAFLEFADFGNGFAHTMLILRADRIRPDAQFPNGHLLVYGPDISANSIVTHVYAAKNGVLEENGVLKPAFTFSTTRIDLQVETTFIDPSFDPSMMNYISCCDACEWVHSLLDIHGVDWLCCLGCCGSAAAAR
jgi:hypothetical protein